MTETIDDYFNQGLVAQAFLAEQNILIWQQVAGEISFLKKQPKHVQDLYKFIQQAAQTNFVLSLGKLYDATNKKYPTRCILSFLDLLTTGDLTVVKIVETTNTIKLLHEFNCNKALIDAVNDPDPKLFLQLFISHFRQKYNELSLQQDINTLKNMRDKAVAHNEVVGSLKFDFKTAERLLNFASQLISIFGMAYHSTIWQTKYFSFIKKNAEHHASFVRANIYDLKKKTACTL